MKRVIFLIMVGSVYLFAAEFRIESFGINRTDRTAADTDTKLVDVNGNICAVVKVKTELKDVMFDSSLLEKVISRDDGEYWVYLPRNTKRLMLKKEGVIPYTYTFPDKLEEAAVYVMELAADGLTEEQKRDGRIFISVITEPEGGNVTFDGVDLGIVNQIETDEGEHEILIEKKGYKNLERKIKVSQKDTFFEYEMESVLDDDYIFVKGGSFMMGSEEGEFDERSVHKVTLDGFFINKYEVTQKQWKEVTGKNPSHFKGDSLPVEQVGWYEVIVFCNKLSEMKGFESCYIINGSKDPKDWGRIPLKYNQKWDEAECDWKANGFRLPTEAEWEYAARGGEKSRGYLYSGSNSPEGVAVYGWTPELGEMGDQFKTTRKVGSKSPNELGIYDMTGNVAEWCWDVPHKYGWEDRVNPRTSYGGSYRIFRGGSWKSEVYKCRSAYRGKYGDKYEGTNDIGLRLVCVP